MMIKQKQKQNQGPRCANCSNQHVELLEIVMPPEIRAKTLYCRSCLDVVLDKARTRH